MIYRHFDSKKDLYLAILRRHEADLPGLHRAARAARRGDRRPRCRDPRRLARLRRRELRRVARHLSRPHGRSGDRERPPPGQRARDGGAGRVPPRKLPRASSQNSSSRPPTSCERARRTRPVVDRPPGNSAGKRCMPPLPVRAPRFWVGEPSCGLRLRTRRRSLRPRLAAVAARRATRASAPRRPASGIPDTEAATRYAKSRSTDVSFAIYDMRDRLSSHEGSRGYIMASDLQGHAPRRLPPSGLGRRPQPDRRRARPAGPDDPRVRQRVCDAGARHAGPRADREPGRRGEHVRLRVERHLGLLPRRAEGRRPPHAAPAGAPAEAATATTRCASSRTSFPASAGASRTSSPKGWDLAFKGGWGLRATASSTRWPCCTTAKEHRRLGPHAGEPLATHTGGHSRRRVPASSQGPAR